MRQKRPTLVSKEIYTHASFIESWSFIASCVMRHGPPRSDSHMHINTITRKREKQLLPEMPRTPSPQHTHTHTHHGTMKNAIEHAVVEPSGRPQTVIQMHPSSMRKRKCGREVAPARKGGRRERAGVQLHMYKTRASSMCTYRQGSMIYVQKTEMYRQGSDQTDPAAASAHANPQHPA